MDFGLTDTMIKKIGWHLRHFPQVETAILFGSRGKGNFREDSDIDLALKGDGITDDMLHDIQQTLSQTTVPYKFDVVIYDKITDPALLEHIQQVGKIFYEKKNCAIQHRRYQLFRYSIPVDSQLILRNRFLKKREGLLVKVCCGQNEGWGEIAPLPEFSHETLDQAQAQAIEWLEKWDHSRSCNVKLDLTADLYPSVAFGLSCALMEMKGRLDDEGNYQTAPLCYGDPDELYELLDQMQGEKVAKVKVGMYEANRDGLIADMLLEAIPDLQLRLDANRSWTPAKAQMFAKYVKPEHRARIQFIEEPCKTREESRQFAAETGINIAWDESVREPDFRVEKEPHLAAIVIKPTLVGSIERCAELIEQAHALGMKAVISSSIESSFGLTQLARMAKQYTPNVTPGLDTLDLMDYQVVRTWPGSTLPVVGLDSEFITEVILD